jgi:alpha-galactosidase
MISFDPGSRTFHLRTPELSYLFGTAPTGDLHHLHWGAPLTPTEFHGVLEAWEKIPPEDSHHVSLEKHSREFADFGHNDLRSPAYHLEHADGTRVCEFRYLSHDIVPGKPDFGPGPSAEGLPGDGVETLKVVLRDALKGWVLELYYTLHPREGVLVRRSGLRNEGKEPLNILKFSSASMDLPPGDRHLVSFTGAWARERTMKTRPLYQGTLRLESRRGISSHETNPFAVVTKGPADEEHGEVFGLALATSGNWLMEFQGTGD